MDKSFTIWFTGLQRAGKTTVASLLAKELRELGCKVEVLDVDVVRPYIMKSLIGCRFFDRPPVNKKHFLRHNSPLLEWWQEFMLHWRLEGFDLF